MEETALLLEEAMPYSPEASRTTTHVVDPNTDWGPRPELTLYPRCRLLVGTSYGRWGDRMVGYGNRTALERKRPKVQLAYLALYEEYRIPLIREWAEELLATGELPEPVVKELGFTQRYAEGRDVDQGDPLEGLANDHRKGMMGHGAYGVAPGARGGMRA